MSHYYACSRAWTLIAIAGCLAASATASEPMSIAQQNALVQKYCAMCHMDAARSGGLSLEHFDASTAAPSLTAMMLSKLTGGVALETVKKASLNESAAALVNKNMRTGAMGASGVPKPDKATIDAFIQAFAMESNGATKWTVIRMKTADATAPELMASMLREMPFAASPGEAEAYRLMVACNPTTHESSIKVAWSPIAEKAKLTASADGREAVNFDVARGVRRGDPSSLAVLTLGLPLPAESLTIKDPSPSRSVVFPFVDLPKDVQHEFAACFAGSEHR